VPVKLDGKLRTQDEHRMSGMTSLWLPQWYWYEVIGSVCVAIKWRGLLSPLGREGKLIDLPE